MCLRGFLLTIAISAVLSAPQNKQITQTNTAGGGLAGVAARVQDPKCLQPKEPGPCRMNLDRFYYNAQTNACEPFKFGGCRGNDNKFGFLKTCEDACVVAKTTANNAAANSKASAAAVGPKAAAAIAPISTTTKSPIAAQSRPQPVKPIK
ncbi:PREDICTED: putative Kunitz-type serine protease inhibitor [Rhagoletis zephyria]|uniref:putative Kunitz-type serine protease inhibitor n=1 Tax=Rhagoletis zephyria TaxID=28612 RepID=UPI00081137D3|nr:PREDICTED: putative Kunitz-type serine protease inhibitor [Rhagoletis zephyria]